VNQNDNHNDTQQRAERLLPEQFTTTSTHPYKYITGTSQEDSEYAGGEEEGALDETTGQGDADSTISRLYTVVCIIRESLACLEYAPKNEINKKTKLVNTVKCLEMVQDIIWEVKDYMNTLKSE
jgi:hypothetical protein